MADLLDMFGTGGQFEGELKKANAYLDEKQPSDFVAKVTEFVVAKHGNKESPQYGQEYLRIGFEVVEVTAGCPLSHKEGGRYETRQGRPGDNFSVKKELSGVGMKKSKAEMEVKDLTRIIATLEDDGSYGEDFLPGGRRGPAAFRECLNSEAKYVGKLVRFAGKQANDKGFYNPKMEAVPSDEPVTASPAKGKKTA